MFRLYAQSCARGLGLPMLAPVDPATRVADGIYIGSLATAMSDDQLAQNGIGLVINLSPTDYTCRVPVVAIKMEDTTITVENADDYVAKFAGGIRAIRDARAAGVNVLVHCAAGINRSATQICMFLIDCGWTYDQAVGAIAAANAVRGVPYLTNPSFRQLLRVQDTLNRTRRRI